MFLSIKRLANLRYSLCYDSIWLQPWQMSQRAVTFTLWLQRFRRKAAFGNSLLGFCFRIAMPQPQSFSHSWKSLIPWSTCRVESPLVSPQNALEWIFECWIDALHIQFFEFGALRKHLETHHSNVFKPPFNAIFQPRLDVQSDELCSFVEFLSLTPKSHEAPPAAFWMATIRG